MRNSVIVLLLLLLLGAVPAWASDTIPYGKTVRVTATDKANNKKEYKQLVKAIRLRGRAEKMSSPKAKMKTFKKAVPILEKVIKKTNCANIAMRADQEIHKIQKLEGRVEKQNKDSGGFDAPFMYGPYF